MLAKWAAQVSSQQRPISYSTALHCKRHLPQGSKQLAPASWRRVGQDKLCADTAQQRRCSRQVSCSRAGLVRATLSLKGTGACYCRPDNLCIIQEDLSFCVDQRLRSQFSCRSCHHLLGPTCRSVATISRQHSLPHLLRQT